VAWKRLKGRRPFRQARGKGCLPEDAALRKAACSRRSEGPGLKKAGLKQLRASACCKACRTASGRQACHKTMLLLLEDHWFCSRLHSHLQLCCSLFEELKRQDSIHSSYTNSPANQQCMLTILALPTCSATPSGSTNSGTTLIPVSTWMPKQQRIDHSSCTAPHQCFLHSQSLSQLDLAATHQARCTTDQPFAKL
jgi:hypothetical protein